MKKFCTYLFYILTIIVLLKFRVIQVNGQSMYPTLKDKQYCIALNTDKINDGDIIVLTTKGKDLPADYIIKRFYEDKSDYYTVFVQGDNTNNSIDSRKIGNFNRENVICKVILPLPAR